MYHLYYVCDRMGFEDESEDMLDDDKLKREEELEEE